MKLQELMPANDFSGKFASEGRYDRLFSLAVAHNLNWEKLIGEPVLSLSPNELSVWQRILASLTGLTKTDENLKILASLKDYLRRSGVQESTELQEPFKINLKESYSDYLRKLV